MRWWTGYDCQVSAPLTVTSAIGLAAPSAMDGVEAVLQVNGLGKCYSLYASPAERLKALLGLADRFTPHWALRDVSFQLTLAHAKHSLNIFLFSSDHGEESRRG